MPDPDDFLELKNQVARLTHDVALLGDAQAIRKLQHAYGYYLDKCLYDEVVDLFADDAELRFMGGIFRGKAGIRRLYCGRFRQSFTGGHNGPVYGFLLDHLQLQDIVDVAADRRTAFARFRALMQAGSHKSRTDAPASLPSQWWEGGIYENIYAREEGVWKIKLLNYRLVYQGLYEEGWANMAPYTGPFFTATYPDNPLGPDALAPVQPVLWPETDVVAFHYVHPVTGKPWQSSGA